MAEWDAPTLVDVAGYLPTRTKDEFGNIVRVEGGDDDGKRTFSADTEPTDDDVQVEIDKAVTVVQSDVGSEFCEAGVEAGFDDKAAELAALYAAMLVEVGYYPEQIGRNMSPYPQLKELYDAKRTQLRGEVDEVCGDVPGPDSEAAGGPDIPAPQWGGFDVEYGSGLW